jgi:hypothetical protein
MTRSLQSLLGFVMKQEGANGNAANEKNWESNGESEDLFRAGTGSCGEGTY